MNNFLDWFDFPVSPMNDSRAHPEVINEYIDFQLMSEILEDINHSDEKLSLQFGVSRDIQPNEI